MAKYLTDVVVDEAIKFDPVVGAFVTNLAKLGVASYPDKRSNLFFHFCRTSNINVTANLTRTLVWVDTLETNVANILIRNG